MKKKMCVYIKYRDRLGTATPQPPKFKSEIAYCSVGSAFGLKPVKQKKCV